MADDSTDNAGVAVPPPLVYALGFGLGYGLDRLKPVPLGLGGVRTLLGWALAGAGVALAASAIALFRRAGTSPVPIQPTTAPVVLVVIRWRVIAREEAYLERKFGDVYRTYTTRVRRWL